MPERIFDTKEAAKFMTEELKTPIRPSTLANKRITGGGPLFSRVCRRIQYKESRLRDWVGNMQERDYSTTAEADRG